MVVMRLLIYIFILLFYNTNSFNYNVKNFKSFGFKLASKLSSINNPNKLMSQGCIVEYISGKGSKRLALVVNKNNNDPTSNKKVNVVNDLDMSFTISSNKITYVIPGNYEHKDLIEMQKKVDTLESQPIEKMWEQITASDLDIEYTAENTKITYIDISEKIYSNKSESCQYLSAKLMDLYGNIYFENSNGGNNNHHDGLFIPLNPQKVQQNLRERSLLREFKTWFIAMNTMSKKINTNKYNDNSRINHNYNNYYNNNGNYNFVASDRIKQVIRDYEDGLMQLVAGGHPWVVGGSARRSFDMDSINKAKKFLIFLDLAPSVKNAKKVMDVIGLQSRHMNIEKYVMMLRDTFPSQVLEEAQYLMDNWKHIPDPDERIRRDLRHLGSYAIDSEGATEVDDAVSIERLADGREKLWIHIADVSRWVRPGSELSLEAERRMQSVYMPDEKISMFPEQLSTELMSLGAHMDSCALSCGVVLTPSGDVESWEVCPSKIRLTKRISYSLLDEILVKFDHDGSSDNNSNNNNDMIIDDTDEVEDNNNNDNNVITSINTLNLGDVLNQELRSNDNNNHNNNNKGNFNNNGSKRSYIPRSSSSSSSLLESLRLDTNIVQELVRLNHWAKKRYTYRINNGALDCYLRDKTDLSILVKRHLNSKGGNVQLKTPRHSINTYLTWSNATSTSLVSEYMILMCQTIGRMCVSFEGPSPSVWYKTQVPLPPLNSRDLELTDSDHHNPLLRTMRLLMHLQAANDSKIPGPHATTGSDVYVQCTSPIRRYHDLYNHYRLKAAMHGASLSEDWMNRAAEEAGIAALDKMASAKERLQTLDAIRMVVREREKYWLHRHIDRMIDQQQELGISNMNPNNNNNNNNNKGEIECVILQQINSTSLAVGDSDPPPGYVYEVVVLQLGCYQRYRLYSIEPITKGEIVKGRIVEWSPQLSSRPTIAKMGRLRRAKEKKGNRISFSYIVLPLSLKTQDMPEMMRQIAEVKK